MLFHPSKALHNEYSESDFECGETDCTYEAAALQWHPMHSFHTLETPFPDSVNNLSTLPMDISFIAHPSAKSCLSVAIPLSIQKGLENLDSCIFEFS